MDDQTDERIGMGYLRALDRLIVILKPPKDERIEEMNRLIGELECLHHLYLKVLRRDRPEVFEV